MARAAPSAPRPLPAQTRDHRAAAAFTALRDAYDLLSDKSRRASFDAELARQDERERRARARRRAAAAHAARRALAALVEHWRWTLGAAVLLLALGNT